MQDKNDLSGSHVEASMIEICSQNDYCVHAPNSRFRCANFIPDWATICFSLGFPDSIFLANGYDALPGLAKMPKNKYQPNLGTALLNTQYAGSALLKEGTPLTDDNLGYSVSPKQK